MPHSRKHLKQSGDVHPPEVENDLAAGPEEASAGPGGGAVPEASAAEPAPAAAQRSAAAEPGASPLGLDAGTERVFDAARAQVRSRPLAYAAGAFAIGFLLAVIAR